MHGNIKRTDNEAMAVTIASPIATSGEVFSDGSTIELIGDFHYGNPGLMLWDGGKETIGSVVEYKQRLYKSAPIKSSILQELTLPTRSCAHGTTREFLAEICRLISNFSGLPEKAAFLTGRIVLCSALIDALPMAPTLTITGPDPARGNQLLALLRCICRHSLPLTGVTPAEFCSLANGPRFTYLISQSSISDKLKKLLDDASSRDRKIPFRGGLLDLFGVRVIHCDSTLGSDSWPLQSIQVSMIPTGAELPAFDLETQCEIKKEFQAKLLSFRRANLGTARRLEFDVSRFTFELRDLARSIAVATPDDTTLQADVLYLLREEDAEIRDQRWLGLAGIATETILVAWSESPGGSFYISELAVSAQELFRRRGQEMKIDPGLFGKILRQLGFTTEPRDARGKKLKVTEAIYARARQLARDFGVPEIENDRPEGREDLRYVSAAEPRHV